MHNQQLILLLLMKDNYLIQYNLYVHHYIIYDKVPLYLFFLLLKFDNQLEHEMN